MDKKQLIALLACLVFSLTTMAAVAAAAPKDVPTATIRIAHASPTKYPKQVWAQTIKTIVEDRTAGKVKVEIYPRKQLYKDADGMVALAQGALEMFITSSGHLPTWNKRWSIYSFPGLFSDHKQAHRFMDSPCCEATLSNILEPKGIKVLAQYAIGPTTIFTINQAKSIEDLKGLKLRSTKNPVTLSALAALGAGAVSLGVADTYTSLQQGMVDGVATPLTTNMTHKWNEITKYNLALPISFGVNIPTASLKWWNSLSPSIREILEKEAIPEANKRTRAYSEGLLNKAKTRAINSGMVFNEPPQEDMAKFENIMKPIYKKYEPQLGKALFDCARTSK
jgi:C4-dicarboxylate-binding protein DctP